MMYGGIHASFFPHCVQLVPPQFLLEAYRHHAGVKFPHDSMTKSQVTRFRQRHSPDPFKEADVKELFHGKQVELVKVEALMDDFRNLTPRSPRSPRGPSLASSPRAVSFRDSQRASSKGHIAESSPHLHRSQSSQKRASVPGRPMSTTPRLSRHMMCQSPTPSGIESIARPVSAHPNLVHPPSAKKKPPAS